MIAAAQTTCDVDAVVTCRGARVRGYGGLRMTVMQIIKMSREKRHYSLICLSLALAALVYAPCSAQSSSIGYIEYDVTQDQSFETQRSFTLQGKAPYKVRLNFKPDPRSYWLVRFVKIPDDISLKFDEGKDKVKENEWHTLTKNLPIILEIKAEAQSPIAVNFQLGPAINVVRKDNWQDVKRQANNGALQINFQNYALAFILPQPSPNNATPTQPAANNGTSIQPSAASPKQKPGIIAALISSLTSWPGLALAFLIAVAVICMFFLPSVRRSFGFLNGQGAEEATGSSSLSSPSSASDIFGGPGYKISDGGRMVSMEDKVSDASRTAWIAPKSETPSTSGMGQHYSAPERRVDNQEAFRDMTSKLEGKMAEMGNFLAGKIDQSKDHVHNYAHSLGSGLLAGVDDLRVLIQKQNELQKEFQSVTKTELVELIERHMDSSAKLVELAIGRAEQSNSNNKKDLADLEKCLRQELDLLKNGLTDFATRHGSNEEFYARKLGLIFDRNVDSLKEETVAELASRAGANLDRFIQEGIVIPERLQSLSKIASDVSVALRLVADAVQKSRKQAAIEKISGYVKNADDLMSQLSNFQNQAGSRDLQLDLKVSVSALKGARYTFLEQLGMTVKKELDKWRDPQGHWTRELDRVITDNIPKVTDICDREVSAPGMNPELEQALKLLFQQARLTEILPRQGEAYKSGEQDFNQVLAGGKRETVANVISRGFTYDDGGQVRLLRKAMVNIYQ